MKKNRIACLCAAICAAFGMLLLPGVSIKVHAAEIIATVQGKVMEGTTSSMLYLDTSEGKMEIKIDGETNAGGCKVLLPNKVICVSVSYGSDGYLHAVTIAENQADASISLNMDSISTVTGTLNKKTTAEVLHLNTVHGEMELKLDRTTDMSGCSLLVVSGNYTVRCVRGSDAYMHAVSISDAGSVPSYSSQDEQSTVTNVSGTTRTVSGTVTDNTEESKLYLSTSEGVYIFKIDANTDTSRGRIAMPGSKLMVTFYRGSDDYQHAAAVVGVKDSSSATVDTSSQSTVTGTVNAKSNENMLYLNTAQGEMELKLDKLESLNGCKILVKGRKISVNCARGSDAYMHAVSITAVK